MEAIIDCGIIIALREEFEASAFFEGFSHFFQTNEKPVGGTFLFNYLDGSGVERRGAVEIIENMGPLEAYRATVGFLERFNPRLVVNVGLAGALSKDVGLGDVVIGDVIDQFDHRAKAVPSNADSFDLQWAGDHLATDDDLRKQFAEVWKHRSRYQEWQRRSEVRRSGQWNDRVVRTDADNDATVHCGPIASGNIVGAARAFKDELLRRNRNFMAIEMEAAGVLKACKDKGRVPTVVVKGISDPADQSKGQLDVASRGMIRHWAMGNALDLVADVVRRLSSEAPQQDPVQPLSRGTDVVERLLSLAKRHFKKHHAGLLSDLDGSFQKYDALFRPITSAVDPAVAGNLFLDLAATVSESQASYPLLISGRPGTGKTTFLTLLYLALYQLAMKDESDCIPAYVNLKRYTTPVRGQEEKWNATAAMQDDFVLIEEALAQVGNRPVVFLIDGIDEYVRHDDQVERRLVQLIHDNGSVKKIIGIGLNYIADNERFKRDLSHLQTPARTVTLGSIASRDSANVSGFVEKYLALEPAADLARARTRVLRLISHYGLKSVDLLTVSLMAQTHRSHADQPGTLGELFEDFCTEFLRTDGGTESIDAAAQLAFEFTIKQDTPFALEQHVNRRAWKLVHSHETVKDFLVAFHAVKAFREVRAGDKDRLQELAYVYPHRVNSFVKDLANRSRVVQLEVLEGAQVAFREGPENAKPNACYVAGRLSDSNARIKARDWLRQCMAEIESLGRVKNGRLSPGEMLIARTVYISLACLLDEEASETYLQRLVEDPYWNDINRGFHLEYYDDIVFDPARQLSHQDELASFEKTREALVERIDANLGKKYYGLFNLEVFTLYSLAQHRHSEEGGLDPSIRKDLLSRIPRLLLQSNLSRIVREYLTMLQEHFKLDFVSPGQLVQRVYRLKTELRAGWRRRNLHVKRTESVAEHVFGAYMLGLLYLPDASPESWTNYSKQEVLNIIMVHDLAEALVGDFAAAEATEEKRAQEREAFRKLAMWQTYPAVFGLRHAQDYWLEFESGTTENARIARDLDKLENLLQLRIYSREVRIPDLDEWSVTLRNEVSTKAGQRVLRLLDDGELVRTRR